MKFYIKKYAKGTALLALMVTFLSCTNDETGEQPDEFQEPFGAALFKSQLDIDASVYIAGSSTGGFLGKFDIQGSFAEKDGSPAGGVKLEVNGLSIPYTGPMSGSHHRTIGWDRDSNDFQNLLAFEGDSVPVAVTSYAQGDFKGNTYFPDILKLDSIANPIGLDRNKDLRLSWNQERNGVGKILVMMLYRGPHSNQLNPSNPVNRNYQIVELIDSDNGSYTVPSTVLTSTFPKDSYVDLFVFRGNSSVVRNDDGNLLEVVNFSYDGGILIFDK